MTVWRSSAASGGTLSRRAAGVRFARGCRRRGRGEVDAVVVGSALKSVGSERIHERERDDLGRRRGQVTMESGQRFSAEVGIETEKDRDRV